MTDKEHIEDSIVKFKYYNGIIADTKDVANLKKGDYRTATKMFHRNLYLELYTSILISSIDWCDETTKEYSEDAPITIDDVNSVINKGIELIKATIELPILL